MSETTTPTGGSNANKSKEVTVKEVKGNLNGVDKVLVCGTDFITKEKEKDEKDGANGASGSDETSTVVVTGNTVTYDGQNLVQSLNTGAYVGKPLQVAKEKEDKKQEETQQEDKGQEQEQ